MRSRAQAMAAILASALFSACTSATSHLVPSPSLSPSPSASISTPSPSPSPWPSMPPSPPTRLQVTGSLTTHSDPTFGTGCAFNDFAKGRVRFVSGPMLLPSGGALRLGMDVVPAVGSQAADHPLVLGIRTPVGIQQYTTSASGAMLGDWLATSGVVTISSVHDLGLSDRWGMMSGTIDADLAQSGGAKPLHVTGSWGCVVDPVLS